MSRENPPDTHEYDEKIKRGEDAIREESEAKIGELSDEAKSSDGYGRAAQETTGGQDSNPG